MKTIHHGTSIHYQYLAGLNIPIGNSATSAKQLFVDPYRVEQIQVACTSQAAYIPKSDLTYAYLQSDRREQGFPLLSFSLEKFVLHPVTAV